MNLTNKILLCLLITLASCLNKVRVYMPKPLAVMLGPSGSITLTSAAFTIKTTATINLSCSAGATHYKESATTPSANDGGWISCPSGSTVITPALSAGENVLKYWFKNEDDVSSSLDLNIFQGPKRILSPDASNTDSFASENVIELTPTRFLVTDPQNSTVASRAGAVHIYDERGNLVRSIYGSVPDINFGGDKAECEWTCFGTTGKLSNGRFYVATPEFDSAGGMINDGGIIQFFNSDGDKLFDLEGDDNLDFMGDSEIMELSNGNIVVQTWGDNEGGLNNVGSIFILNGTNGAVIAKITGDAVDDRLGSTALLISGNNIIAASEGDDVGGISNVGTVKIINGANGAILNSIEGSSVNNNFSSKGVTLLANGNLVIASPNDEQGGITNIGSITLVNATTGAVISKTYGDQTSDNFGYDRIVKLNNNNFAAISSLDNTATLSSAGSVTIFDGATGGIIATVAGDDNNDRLGSGGVIKLSNGNLAIASPNDVVGGNADVGSVKIINVTDGSVIATLTGNDTGDEFGKTIASLGNGNFIINSPEEITAAGTISQAGSVNLVSNAGGVIATLVGSDANERLGVITVVLSNGNYVVNSSSANNGALTNSGSVYLIDGLTGTILTTISGDHNNDQIGNGDIDILANGNFIISSNSHDFSGITNAGSIMLVNGSTGAIMQTVAGDDANEAFGLHWIEKFSDNYFMIINYSEIISGKANAGSGILLDGSSGDIVTKISGDVAGDKMSYSGALELSNGSIIMRSSQDTVGALTNTGSVYIIPRD